METIYYIMCWLLMGLGVNLYYFNTNHKEYTAAIKGGRLTVRDLLVRFYIVLWFFPIAILNNELRK